MSCNSEKSLNTEQHLEKEFDRNFEFQIAEVERIKEENDNK